VRRRPAAATRSAVDSSDLFQPRDCDTKITRAWGALNAVDSSDADPQAASACRLPCFQNCRASR
jgi:hypothetical protein